MARSPRSDLLSRKFQLMKTYIAKPGEVEQKWWLVDASDKVVGRLASDIAMLSSKR